MILEIYLKVSKDTIEKVESYQIRLLLLRVIIFLYLEFKKVSLTRLKVLKEVIKILNFITIATIDKYRSAYINIKDIIIFTFLKIKEIYDL